MESSLAHIPTILVITGNSEKQNKRTLVMLRDSRLGHWCCLVLVDICDNDVAEIGHVDGLAFLLLEGASELIG